MWLLESGAPPIPVSRLLLVLIPLGLVFLLLRRSGDGIERRLPLAALRGAVQLSVVGYVLVPLFGIRNPFLVLAVLSVMCALAAFFSLGLLGRASTRGLWILAMVAILPVVVGLTLFALGAIMPGVGVLEPRYAISLAGMLAGNAMNAVALAGQRYLATLEERRREVEALLMLGASGAEAGAGAFSASLRAAVTPSLNSLVSVGLVSLPGMMTGQIMDGGNPVVAARYQMMIMGLWTSAATLAPILFLGLLGRVIFAEGRLHLPSRHEPWRRFQTRDLFPLRRRPPVHGQRPPEGGS